MVRPLAERLRADGVKVWFDEWVLNLGDSIAKAPEGQRIRLLLKALRPAQPPLILDNLESLPQGDRNQLFTFVKRLQPG